MSSEGRRLDAKATGVEGKPGAPFNRVDGRSGLGDALCPDRLSNRTSLVGESASVGESGKSVRNSVSFNSCGDGMTTSLFGSSPTRS
jgi:hypothetical protein